MKNDLNLSRRAFIKKGALYVPPLVFIPKLSRAQWGGVLGGNRGAAAASTAFVTNSSYTNRSGAFSAGFVFTVGGANISVTALGRFVTATGSKTRVVKIFNFSSSGAYAQVATGSIDLTGAALNTYPYLTITPVTLTASTKYLIASDEFANDIGWADNQTLTTTGAATVNGHCYYDSAFPVAYANWVVDSSSDGFAGVNFKYQ